MHACAIDSHTTKYYHHVAYFTQFENTLDHIVKLYYMCLSVYVSYNKLNENFCQFSKLYTEMN